MKKILYSFLLCSSTVLFAQKNPSTRFAVANDIVGTVDMFTIRKDIVQSKSIYKTAATLPQNLKKYSFIADKGLTEVKIKAGYETLDRLTISQLNEQYQLPKGQPVLIDGYEFSNPETAVYGDVLGKMEVKDDNGRKTLFISTQR
ncbi:hypothetical protein VUJ46_22920 [Chryseobacterium sp. MYb264]|uniref:hypothetical protein n=1 Tax=Chryseobacterium sp. MYb264 TaxID=2745153 RepID=UPI002E0FEC3F|nr:hypothetical protein VUJ46_22920 [Chryseobacterium sp. MYb264]